MYLHFFLLFTFFRSANIYLDTEEPLQEKSPSQKDSPFKRQATRMETEQSEFDEAREVFIHSGNLLLLSLDQHT